MPTVIRARALKPIFSMVSALVVWDEGERNAPVSVIRIAG